MELQSHLRLGILFRAHSGYWQNLVSCGFIWASREQDTYVNSCSWLLPNSESVFNLILNIVTFIISCIENLSIDDLCHCIIKAEIQEKVS